MAVFWTNRIAAAYLECGDLNAADLALAPAALPVHHVVAFQRMPAFAGCGSAGALPSRLRLSLHATPQVIDDSGSFENLRASEDMKPDQIDVARIENPAALRQLFLRDSES